MAEPKRHSEERRASGRLLDPIDTAIAALILAACAYLWYVTTTFDEVPTFLGENVLPEHFPRLALIFIALCALVVPFEHRIFPDRWKRIKEDRSEPITRVTWLTMLLLTVVVWAEPHIGTVITIIAICVALPVLWGERRWRLIIPFAIGFAVVVTFVFNDLLKVYFEPGVFNISF